MAPPGPRTPTCSRPAAPAFSANASSGHRAADRAMRFRGAVAGPGCSGQSEDLDDIRARIGGARAAGQDVDSITDGDHAQPVARGGQRRVRGPRVGPRIVGLVLLEGAV